jgi:probable HAF family extracellular repeat protein
MLANRENKAFRETDSMIDRNCPVGFPMNLRIARSIWFVLAFLVLTAAAQAQNKFTVIDLGTLGPSLDYSAPGHINDSGQVVGGTYLLSAPNNLCHAFLYSEGTMTDLGTLRPNSVANPWAFASGVNSSGQIVGESTTDPAGRQHAFLFSGGKMIDIGGSELSFALAINDGGQIVGASIEMSGTTGSLDAFLYSGGKMVDIVPYAMALAINNSGQVVGSMSIIDKATLARFSHSFVYSAGVTKDLGMLQGDANSEAASINDLGQIVGCSYVTTDSIGSPIAAHAYLYSNGVMSNIGGLGGGSTFANGINNSGQIVGQSLTPGGVFHAFLYSGGVVADLNALVDLSSSDFVTLTNATALNNKGQIVGTGTTKSGNTHAFLLTPIAASANVPVIFIPGMGGSELWCPSWPVDVRVWPGIATFVNILPMATLQFDATGVPSNSASNSIYVAPTPLASFGPIEVYGWDSGICTKLRDSGRTVKYFTYDFRYPVEYNAVLLRDFIDSLCPNPGDQVDIVAHSMGGLVALSYAQIFQSREHRVRRFVSLGTPYLGSVRALQALRAGWNMDVGEFSPSNLKRMAHNWPGLYELLPSPTLQADSVLGPSWYHSDSSVDTFAFGSDWRAGLNPVSVLEFKASLATLAEPVGPDFSPLMSSDPPPQTTLSPATLDQAFQNMASREARGLPSEISALAIAGELIDYTTNQAQGSTPIRFDERPIVSGYTVTDAGLQRNSDAVWHYWLEEGIGDGTVPIASARGLTGSNVINTTVFGPDHTGLVADPTACMLATNFLNGTNIGAPVQPIAMANNTVTIVAHSPVTLDVVDAYGRHTTISDDTIVQDDPDVRADRFGEGKALIFSSTAAIAVQIKGTAVGAVTLEVITSDTSGRPVSSRCWLEYPVTAASVGSLSVTSTGPVLSWDVNGSGKPNYVGGPDSDGDGVPDAIDKYPNTPLDAVVNSDGGDLAQIVPIDGNWKNRGEYLAAFTRAAREFVAEGLLTPREAADAVREAGESYPTTGKPHRPPCKQGKWGHHRRHWRPHCSR